MEKILLEIAEQYINDGIESVSDNITAQLSRKDFNLNLENLNYNEINEIEKMLKDFVEDEEIKGRYALSKEFEEYSTPLYIAYEKAKEIIESIERLEEEYKKQDDINTAMERELLLKQAKEQIESTTDVSSEQQTESSSEQQEIVITQEDLNKRLLEAVEENNNKKFKETIKLTNQGGCELDYNQTNEEGQPLILIAAKNGNAEMVKTIIENAENLNLNFKDDNGAIPLMYIVSIKNLPLPIVKKAIELTDEELLKIQDYDGATVLDYAEDRKRVKKLLEEKGLEFGTIEDVEKEKYFENKISELNNLLSTLQDKINSLEQELKEAKEKGSIRKRIKDLFTIEKIKPNKEDKEKTKQEKKEILKDKLKNKSMKKKKTAKKTTKKATTKKAKKTRSGSKFVKKDAEKILNIYNRLKKEGYF